MIKTSVSSTDISLILESIDAIFGFTLTGEVRGLAGVLNSNANYAVQRMEESLNIPSAGDWGYYAGQVSNAPSR